VKSVGPLGYTRSGRTWLVSADRAQPVADAWSGALGSVGAAEPAQLPAMRTVAFAADMALAGDGVETTLIEATSIAAVRSSPDTNLATGESTKPLSANATGGTGSAMDVGPAQTVIGAALDTATWAVLAATGCAKPNIKTPAAIKAMPV